MDLLFSLPSRISASIIASLNSLLKNYFQYKIKVFIEKEFILLISVNFCYKIDMNILMSTCPVGDM